MNELISSAVFTSHAWAIIAALGYYAATWNFFRVGQKVYGVYFLMTSTLFSALHIMNHFFFYNWAFGWALFNVCIACIVYSLSNKLYNEWQKVKNLSDAKKYLQKARQSKTCNL